MANIGTLFITVAADATGVAKGLAQAEASLERFGSRLFFLGSRMTAGVTVPLATLAGSIIKFGSDFDQAMTESLAILDNVSEKTEKDMKDMAMSISTQSKFTAAEVAKAYYGLGSAGIAAEDQLGAIKVATTFAQAGMMDVDKATKVLTQTVYALGGEMVGLNTGMAANAPIADQMARVADVLTRANNKALGTVESFAKALTTRAATSGRIYKVSLEELTAALMAYHDVGIESQQAGQNLWMTLRDLQKASLNNAGAWEQFGVAIYDANQELRPMHVILGEMSARFKGFTKEQILAGEHLVAGAKAAGKAYSDMQISQEMMALGFQDRSRGAIQAVLGMSERIGAAYNDLVQSQGETNKVAEKQMQSFANTMAKYWHMIQVEGIKMFDELRPVIEKDLIPLLMAFIEKLKELVHWFSQLSPETKKWLIIMTGIVALAGPVISMMGSWILFFTTVIGLIGKATGAFVKFADLVTKGGVSNALAQRLATGGTAAGGAQSVTAALGSSKTMIAFEQVGTSLVRMLPNLINLVGKLWWAFAAFSTLKGSFEWLLETGRWRDFFAGITLGLSEVAISFTQKLHEMGDKADQNPFDWRTWLGIPGEILTLLGSIDTIFGHWGANLTEMFANFGKGIRQDWTEWTRGMGQTVENMLWDIEDKAIPMISQLARKMRKALFSTGDQPAGDQEQPAWLSWLGLGKDQWFSQLDQMFTTDSFGNLVKGINKEAERIKQKGYIQAKPLPGMMMGLVPGLGKGPVLPGTIFDSGRTFPPGKPKAKTQAERDAERERERIQGVTEELIGSGKQRFQDVQVAFKNIADVGGVTTDVLERLYEEVKKSGIAFDDLPPFIRNATQELHDFEIAMEMANDPLNEISASMRGFKKQGVLETNMGRFENEFRELYKTGKVSTQFLEEHNEELLQLALRFESLPPGFREVILTWSEWNAEMRKSSPEVKKAKEVLESMGNAVEDVAAQMTDKGREIEALWMTGGQQALKGIKFNQDKMERNFEQQLDKMQKELAENYIWWSDQEKETARLRIEAFKIYADETVKLERQAATDRLLIQTVSSAAVARALKNASLEVKEQIIKDLDEIQQKYQNFITMMGQASTAFGNLASVFDKDGDGILTWLSQVTGWMGEASTAARDFEKASREAMAIWNNPDANFGEKIAGITSAGLSMFEAATRGIVAIDKATSVKGQGKRVLGGIGTGAAVGGGIGAGVGFMVAGPLGAAVGKAVGQIGGALVGGIIGAIRKPGFEDVMKRVGREWGVTISEELAKKIDKLAKDKYKKDRGAAEIASLGEILGEAGGLKESNIGTFMNKFRDIWVMIEKGAFSAAEGMEQYTNQFGEFADFWIDKGIDVASVFSEQMEVMFRFADEGKITSAQVTSFLDKNFAKFVESFEKSGKVASKAFVDLIEKYKALGATSKAVTDFMIAQGSKASTAWATVAQSIGAGELDDFATKLIGTNDQIKEIQDKIKAGEGDVANLTDDLNERLAYREDLLKKQPELAAKFGPAVERMGAIALATFNSMTAAGVPWTEALEATGPAIDTLIKYYDALGISTQNAALQELTRYRNIQQANQALFSGVDALAQGTIALSSMGRISQETFSLIGQQGVDMYAKMQGAVAEFGGTTEDALRPMVPWLTAMRDAADEYGLEIDEGTQALIDQATELGLLKPKAQDATNIMKSGFDNVGKAMDKVAYYLDLIATRIYGLPKYTELEVHTQYTESGEPPSDAPPPPDLPEAAHGIFASGKAGVATWFGEGGEPELGGPKDFMAGVLASAMKDVGGGSWGGGDDINVTLVMPDGDILLQQVIKAGKRRGVV